MGMAGMSEHHRGWREAPRTKSRLHERRVGVGTPRQETGETGAAYHAWTAGHSQTPVNSFRRVKGSVIILKNHHLLESQVKIFAQDVLGLLPNNQGWGRWERVESESEVAQLCLTLCDPVDCSLSGFSVHGILQARILEWVAISFSRGSSRPRDRAPVSCIGGRCFNLWATRKAHQGESGQRCIRQD